MINKRLCFFISSGIILVLLTLSIFPSVSGDNDVHIENPTSVSNIITVNENFSIYNKLTYLFVNSLNQPAQVTYYFPIIEYGEGGVDIYATNSSALASTVNGTVYVYNGTLQPYSDGGMVFEWFIPKSDNNPSDGIHTIDIGVFNEIENLIIGEIEIRIPLQKGDNEYLIEPMNYDIPPNNQYKTDDYLILYWGKDMKQAVHLDYSYEFNLNKFINNHPLEMMFVSGILGVILGIIIDKIIIVKLIDIYKSKKKTKDKKSSQKRTSKRK